MVFHLLDTRSVGLRTTARHRYRTPRAGKVQRAQTCFFNITQNKKKRPETEGLWPLLYVCCGGVLLSHNLSVAVPLALPGLASRFGMEAGRFPGAMTTTRLGVQHCSHCWWGCGLIVVCIVVAARSLCSLVFVTRCVGLLFSVGPLVPVGSRAPRGASTSGLSTRSSGGGLSPHKWGVETSSWSRLPA